MNLVAIINNTQFSKCSAWSDRPSKFSKST